MSSSDSDNNSGWNERLFTAVIIRKKTKVISEQDRIKDIEECLKEGADINTKDKKGNTVLHIAVKRGYQIIIKLLLENGARTDIRNNKGDTAIKLTENFDKQMIMNVSKEPSTSRKSDVTNDNSSLNSSLKRPNRKRATDAHEGNPDASFSKVRLIDISQHESQRNAVPIEHKSNRKRTVDDKFGECAQRPRRTRLTDYATDEDSYGSSGLKRSLHGTVYQSKLLMLILHRAWKMDYPFRLATEMAVAEKFDDIFLHYIDGNGDERYRFVQAKHNQDESRWIKASDLLNVKDGDFSLLKYFISWRKIKKHSEFIGSKLQSFILCTNIRLDKDDLKAKNINVSEVKEPDDFMTVQDRESQPPRYKLVVKNPSDLWKTLRSASDTHMLARELAERAYRSKDINLRIDIMKMYHVALAEEVVDAREKKFFVNFIRKIGLSEKAAEFREILFLNMKRLLPKKNRSEKDIQKVLRLCSLKLSSTFGQKSQKATEPERTQSTELPEDTINETEISCFLDDFILAVNQPNEVELGEIIQREIAGIDGQFNLPDAGFVRDSFLIWMLDWFKAKQGEFLRKENAKRFFDQMEVKLASLKVMALSSEYSERLKKRGIQFICVNKALQKIIDCTKHISNRLLKIIFPNQSLLIALQVCQSLAQSQKREKNQGFIFLSLETLSTPEMMKLVPLVFKWSRHHNLLVVDCESISTEQHLQTLWKPLCDIIKKDVQKRMIVITQTDTDLGTECTDGHQLLHVEDVDCSFGNLTKESQKKLLEKQVIKFQGSDNKTSFGELLGIRDRDKLTDDEMKDLSDIMDSDTLVKLIHGKERQIGLDMIGQDEVVNSYIKRTILQHVVIKKAIFENEDILDLFAISGLNGKLPGELARVQTPSTIRDGVTNSFAAVGADRYVEGKYSQIGETSKMAHRKRNITVLDSGQEEKQFNNLCAGNESCNVHWLKWEQGQYIWKKSVRDINHLVEYRDAGASDVNNHGTGATYLSEDKLTAHDEHVIISDIAGMGKSTMLTYLASKMKKDSPNMLVLKIDLNQYATALLEVSKESSNELTNINAVVRFLVKKLLNGESPLARKVFARFIRRKHKVALIFDGFDEISPNYENTVIGLLKTLANYGIEKLVVATRPHTRELLEAKLNSFSYQISPFLRDDQERFLTNFWTSRFKDSDCSWTPTTKNRMKKYATAIVKKLTDSIDDQTNKFTGIPLQIKLVAEIFENHSLGTQKNFNSCKEFIDSEFDEPEFPEKLNLIYLYNHFVEKKFNVFFEKRGGNLANVDVIAEKNTRKKAFMNKHERLALDTLFDKDKVEKLLLCRQNAPESTDYDIPVERDGIITRFIDGQPHFGHRTYAEYFAAKFFIQILKMRVQNKSIGEILVRDILLEKNNKTIRAFMDWLLSDEHVSVQEAEFWLLQLRRLTSWDNETIFHVAAGEGNSNIIRLFLNCIGANTGDEKFLINVVNGYGETAVHRAIDYGHLGKIQQLIEGADFDVNSKHRNGQTLLHKAAAKGRLDIVEYLVGVGADINSQNKYGTTPLHFTAEEGSLDVVEYVVSKEADINSQNKYGMTPLHFAAKGMSLDLVEYLVGKGADINSQNKDGGTPLHTAAKMMSLNLVKYLVGKGADINSQNKDGTTPLHFAAKGMSLDVVEYLVGKGADVNSQNKDGTTPLHIAAEQRLLNAVEYLVGMGANVNSKNEYGMTPLHFAAEWGSLNAVEYLIGKGADINSQNNDGTTPLHFAAEGGSLDVVEYLVDNGADINSQKKDGTTLLHFSAKGMSLDLVKYLVGKGADINFQNKDGMTPLHIAAEWRSLKVVEYLVGKGADINSQNKDGTTLLHFAAERMSLDLVKYLVGKGADINSQNKDGTTPLQFAAKGMSLDLVKYLVSKGADINSQNKDGTTPLHFAAEGMSLDLVKYLVGKGADINSQNKDGTMPLHIAIDQRSLDVVEHLVGRGADVNFENEYGMTPLHFAAEWGSSNAVEYLVDKGADINSQNKDGTTPLHFAAEWGSLNAVEYLVDKGADINSQNKDGMTPLGSAAEGGSFDVVEYLVGKGADINSRTKDGTTLLHSAANGMSMNLVKYLVGKGTDINSQNKDGTTPLHIAAERRSLDVVEYLVGKGADVNSENEYGMTPLHFAAEWGSLNAVEYLVGKGADINSQNKDGTTPLHFAAEWGSLNAVEYLVGKGADINSQNQDGMTPLHFAAEGGSLDVVEYLVGKGADISSKNKDGTTSLHIAAKGMSLDLVKYLVGKGADINSQNEYGMTPLHFAAEKGSLDVVEYLVGKGADINFQNDDGTTSLHIAAKRGHLDVVKYLDSE